MNIDGEVSFPVDWAREQFPAIQNTAQDQSRFVFMDNAAGAQMPARALESMQEFLIKHNALYGAHYANSLAAEEFIEGIRTDIARLFNAPDPANIFFGLSTTNTLRLLAVSIGEVLKPGDEIIISGLEHEANVSPWLRLQKQGVQLKYWQPRSSQALLETGDLIALLSDKTKIVAITAASNVLGTVPDIKAISEMAHENGAIVVVDGVHYAPHRTIDVVRDQVDFMVCSGYKLFGPHFSMAYCDEKLMNRLPSLNHYFLNGMKFELGAQNYEGVAGMKGVFEYFRALSRKLNLDESDNFASLFTEINRYEMKLCAHMLNGLNSIKGVNLYGISDPALIDKRVATFSFNKDGISPENLSEKICSSGFSCRFGDMYAARLIEHLKLKKSGGVVRVSLCHYNTSEEVERFLEFMESVN